MSLAKKIALALTINLWAWYVSYEVFVWLYNMLR